MHAFIWLKKLFSRLLCPNLVGKSAIFVDYQIWPGRTWSFAFLPKKMFRTPVIVHTKSLNRFKLRNERTLSSFGHFYQTKPNSDPKAHQLHIPAFTQTIAPEVLSLAFFECGASNKKFSAREFSHMRCLLHNLEISVTSSSQSRFSSNPVLYVRWFLYTIGGFLNLTPFLIIEYTKLAVCDSNIEAFVNELETF